MQEQEKNAGFDFDRDVIGEDLVVSGVVYNSTEWVADAEDGVRRRTETVDEPETLGEYEQRLAGDFRQRAEDIGTDFAKAAANLSTGPTLSDLLSRYEHLLSEADDAGFDRDRIRELVDTAFQARQ
ncbi:hypothetical protein F8M49_21460 [Rhodococcus zopfii]|uniref:Uncharacterized protein n=1 Tax=Rhodococcus zopfii TaxID=43772 RepID=A0ABU3WTD4_9NOCA|nr:hypothetical protein [Rhodococcus zopfii]